MLPRFDGSIRLIATIGLLVITTDGLRGERLPLKPYTTAEGLARDQILRIVRDSRGFLWFCTFEGLSRFDGYKFINYTTAEGLPHRSIRDLLETRSGSYWIASGAGAARLNPHGRPLFVVHYPGETENSRSIQRLYEDRRGTVWVGTRNGLYRLDEIDGHVTFQFIDLGMPSRTNDDRWIEDILEDHNGVLWVATRGSGLYARQSNGHVTTYRSHDGLPTDRVNALLEDRNHRVWAGTTFGLAILTAKPDSAPSVTETYTAKHGLPGDWINALLQASDGRIWIGGNEGLGEVLQPSTFAPLRFRTFSRAHGLTDREVETLVEDRDANLWIGTPGKGAMKLAAGGFISYGVQEGLGVPAVGSIFHAQSGELYVFANDRLGRFDGHRFITIRPNFGRLTHFTWGGRHLALQDSAGRWWFATGQGLYRFPKVTRMEQLARVAPDRIYTTQHGLATDDIHLVHGDAAGGIWVHTLRDGPSLTRWEPRTETFHRFSVEDGWASDLAVHAFANDDAGNVWLSTNDGLARYDGRRFRMFTSADGLPVNLGAMHFDAAQRLWVSTDTAGVVRIDNPGAERLVVRSYNMNDGLASSQAFDITSDRWQRIYIATGRGVDRLDPATGQVRNYGEHDGLSSSGPPLAFRDRSGSLWFGSNDVLSRLIPEPDRRRPPSPIWITEVRVAGAPRLAAGWDLTELPSLRLAPDERQVSIDFLGLSFRPGETLRYEYLLDGADNAWSRPTDQRTVHFANLSPGRYRFLVRAIMADGTASPSPASVTFTIARPIWWRAWAITLMAAVGVLMVYSAYRYRVRRLLEIERVRTRIATDLHDDLGASLTRVAILSEVVKRQIGDPTGQSASLLTEMGDSARALVGSLRDIVWAIDGRQGNLSDVVARVRQVASTMFDANGIKWTLDVPVDAADIRLDPEGRRHVLLFFKEAIHNVTRHARCAAVELAVRRNGPELTCEVTDDGRGFDVTKMEKPEAAEGRGLRNMQSRASQLGGRLVLRSSAGEGTRLTLTMSLRDRRRA